MARKSTCAACKEVFEWPPEDEWRDQDARAEAEDIFGLHAGPLSIVCDDCWHKFIAGFSDRRN